MTDPGEEQLLFPCFFILHRRVVPDRRRCV